MPSHKESLQRIAVHGDYFGYDGLSRRRAWRTANAVTIIILGFAIGHFLALLPERNTADVQEIIKGLDKLVGLMTHELVELPEAQRHPESFIVEIIGVLIGYTILRHTKEDLHDYQCTFRRIEQFYTPDERRRGWVVCAACACAATAIIVGMHAVLLTLGTAWSPDCTAGLSQTSLAIGWLLYVYGYMFAARTNLFRYNFRALGRINIYELGVNEPDGRRATQIAEKQLCDLSESLTSFAVAFGVIGALALYFLPSVRTTYFWVPLVAMLAIVIVSKELVLKYAKSKYEPDFD